MTQNRFHPLLPDNTLAEGWAFIDGWLIPEDRWPPPIIKKLPNNCERVITLGETHGFMPADQASELRSNWIEVGKV